MTTINVLDSAGGTVAIEKPLAPSRAAAAASRPVVLSTEDLAQLAAIVTAVNNITKGAGASDATTQRVTIDSSQISAVGPQTGAASVSIVGPSDIPVRSSQDTNALLNGNTALTPKFKVITASSSGATTIVAAVTSKKIRVLAWDIKVNAAVNFKWQSHVTPTDLTGLYYNSGQGDGVARAFNPLGYFETVAGEALDINLSGAVAVGGVLTYVEV